MTKRFPDPSPPQRELDLEPYNLVQRRDPPPWDTSTLKPCAMFALRLGQDQYRCTVCGLLWDVDEPRPPCHRTTDNSENQT